MKPVCLPSYILSFWEHEPPSTAEKTNTGNTELIAWSFIVTTNGRGTFCTQLNLLKLNID